MDLVGTKHMIWEKLIPESSNVHTWHLKKNEYDKIIIGLKRKGLGFFKFIFYLNQLQAELLIKNFNSQPEFSVVKHQVSII